MTSLPDLLTKITKLCEAATAGPWTLAEETTSDGALYPNGISGPEWAVFQDASDLSYDDAEFLISARILLPLLAQVCREQDECLTRLTLPKVFEWTGVSIEANQNLIASYRAHIAELIQGAGGAE